MSAELRIVEHKDCLRCFQPIDERAQVCPYCNSVQVKPNRYGRYLLVGLCLSLTILCVYFWFSLNTERRAGHELSNDLKISQMELDATRSVAVQQLGATDSLRRNSLAAAAKDLAFLVERAQANTATVSAFCVVDSISDVCSRVLIQTSEDTRALAELMGRFEALASRDTFCDQMRPVLTNLVGLSSPGLGADMYNSYYLATASCWLSKS